MYNKNDDNAAKRLSRKEMKQKIFDSNCNFTLEILQAPSFAHFHDLVPLSLS
jgi:hypothetical protein